MAALSQSDNRVNAIQAPFQDASLDIWNTTANAPMVFTYRFGTTDNEGWGFSGWSGLNGAEQTAMRSVMDEYESIANVKFTKVDTSVEANIDFAHVNLGWNGGQGGMKLWIQNGVWNEDAYAVFSTGFDVSAAANRGIVVHEFGHAMTLKHGGNYDVGGIQVPGPYLADAEDNQKYSIMTYDNNPDTGAVSDHLMIYDIAALQARFGANMSYRTGADTYTYTGAGGAVQAIWDAGGTDTINGSAYAGGVTIDLHDGAFSSLGSLNNLAIAFGATIENATGGAGIDRLIGNDVANVLSAGGNNDFLTGAGGNDTLVGGVGIDTAIYSGARANYQVARLSTGHLKITDLRGGSPDGVDDVTTVEKFQFSDGTKSVAQLIDTSDFAVFWTNASNNDTREWTFTNGALSSSFAVGAPASSWHVAATGDFNGDGLSDAIWHDNASGSVRDWLLSSSGVSSAVDLGGTPAGWRVLGAGDFNGDGTSDLLWQNQSSGELREWVMSNGAMSSNIMLGGAASNWRLVGTGDFTGDGTTDMLWRDTSTGEVREWKMANGTISQVSVLGGFASQWGTAATGDFNGDGTTDIIWRNVANGDTRAWLMSNGNLSTNVQLPGPTPNWKLIGAGDFNQNGTDDLLWQNTSTGELREWLLSNGHIASNISLPGPAPHDWHPAVNPATDSDFLPVI